MNALLVFNSHLDKESIKDGNHYRDSFLEVLEDIED